MENEGKPTVAENDDKAAVPESAGGKTDDGNNAKKPPAIKAKPPRPARSGRALAALALLVALLAAAGAGYLGWLKWQELQRTDRQGNEIATLRSELGGRIDQLAGRLGQAEQTSRSDSEQTGQRLDKLAQTVSALQQQLAALRDTDRDQWKLAEVEYLLRLANQRLQLGGELDSAQALLESADDILQKLGYADLTPVRRQVAKDLAAVHAATRVDRDGIYLRLAAAGDQVAGLSFYGMPSVPQNSGQPQTAPTQPEGWMPRLTRGWHEALAALRDLVVVRRHRVEARPLLSESEEQALRARIELLLEQAKTAVLRADAPVYLDSIGRAATLVRRWFRADDATTQSVLAELGKLHDVDVAPALPDITQSQHAIKAYIDGLHQRIVPAEPAQPEAP